MPEDIKEEVEKQTEEYKLEDALTYVLNPKKQLMEFLKDAQIPLTNSKCERAIRPFAVHRKNWLFADTVEGVQKDVDIEKYLPWSSDLPEEILNYQGTCEELNFEE